MIGPIHSLWRAFTEKYSKAWLQQDCTVQDFGCLFDRGVRMG